MNKSFSALKIVVIVLGIVLLSYVVGYFASLNSDAFNEARKFISRSPEVIQELGANVEISMSPFGYELEFAGNQGEASFNCNVVGDRERGWVQINIQKAGGVWMVRNASLHVNKKVVNLRVIGDTH